MKNLNDGVLANASSITSLSEDVSDLDTNKLNKTVQTTPSSWELSFDRAPLKVPTIVGNSYSALIQMKCKTGYISIGIVDDNLYVAHYNASGTYLSSQKLTNFS